MKCKSLMKLTACLIALIVLSGCSTKVQYIDRPVRVEIPVACEIEMPNRPSLENGAKGVSTLLIYATILEETLKKCKGE